MAPRKIPDELQKVLDVERQTRRKAFDAANVNTDHVLNSIATAGMYVTSLYQDRTGEVWWCSLRYGTNGRLARVPPGHGTCMAHALWDALRQCREAKFPGKDLPEEGQKPSAAPVAPVPKDDLAEALGESEDDLADLL